MSGLVLSVFPGIDLLGRAFEEEGYCVVRGPDPLWGGDVRAFSPPAGVFEGVIGGPPCQHWTRLMFLNKNAGKGMEWVVSEFARVVQEAAPRWFLMEEVPYAPMPLVGGYHVHDVLLRDEALGGVQPRQRRFTFGTPDGRMLYVAYHERSGNGRQHLTLAGGTEKRSITSAGGGAHGGGRKRLARTDVPRGTSLTTQGTVWNPETQQIDNVRQDIADACEAMGLPRDFTEHMPFTMHGKRSVIGNGVPMAMSRAVAQAVRRAWP